MPKLNSNNTPKAYDADDLNWSHVVAKEDMQWMITAIGHIKKEIKELNSLAQKGEVIAEYHFSRLITHLDMYEYLVDSRHDYYATQAEEYKKEWEANKKAASL